jgi:transposase
MLNLPPSTKIFLCNQGVDMRKGFDGLSALVQTHFGQNALNGHLFVFFSKQRDRMKILFWQIDGFVLYYKRLEGGTFSWSDHLQPGMDAEIEASDFELLLAGIHPVSGKKQRRYSRPSAEILDGNYVN